MAKKKTTPSSETVIVTPETTDTDTVAKPKAKARAKAAPKAAPKAKKPKEAAVAAADPIGDETDGEASIALDPGVISAEASEIEGAEVEALAEAEIEGDAYSEDEPATPSSSELEGEFESEDGLDGELESESEDEFEGGAGHITGLLSEGEDELEDELGSEAELEGELEDEADAESTPAPRPPAKLERLQKILAQAGVASRRKAEEMIEQGRVQVNGKTVTELGTKADAGRDHIRVDGKLLHGAERLRYFVLNKPKGFVTTVKDPEGRPTVMQFFDKLKERL